MATDREILAAAQALRDAVMEFRKASDLAETTRDTHHRAKSLLVSCERTCLVARRNLLLLVTPADPLVQPTHAARDENGLVAVATVVPGYLGSGSGGGCDVLTSNADGRGTSAEPPPEDPKPRGREFI